MTDKKPIVPMSESARRLNKIMEDFMRMVAEDAKYRRLQKDKPKIKKAA